METAMYNWKPLVATITITGPNTEESKILGSLMYTKKFGMCKRGKRWFIRNYGRVLKNGKGMDRFGALQRLMSRQLYENL